MKLNTKFVANIQELYGAEGASWLNNLAALVQDLSANWGFRFLQVLPNLSYSFVGQVEILETGKTAILKMTPPGGNITREIKWLNSIELAVPQILQHQENAFLMEHLQPGHSLKALTQKDDDAATKIICQLIRNLQISQHNDQDFQPLSELPSALPILEKRFDPRLLSQAQGWFQELIDSAESSVVLHGDLHHDNILSSGDEWRVIDPHGYQGDPVAEVGAMIRNPRDCFPQNRPLKKIIERRLHILRDELPFDPQKIRAWTFCMTVLSAAWTVEGHGQLGELEMEVAHAIDKIKL